MDSPRHALLPHLAWLTTVLVGVSVGACIQGEAPHGGVERQSEALVSAEGGAADSARPQAVDPPGAELGSGQIAGEVPADPRESATVCRRALRCAAECYEAARGGFQSLAQCADPESEACRAARKELAQSAPPLAVTLRALGCATACEPQARTREDLRELDPSDWAKLDEVERGAWTGIIAGADCHPDAACVSICDGEYPAPEALTRRADKANAKAGAAQARQ